ncbi:MAG TPA: ABC transporter permease, partial [Gemmatimonadales bacterium]|nr:ABC transporter permease [Gemmatimonadales bacterium]
MKFLPLVWANLMRHRRRTVLTTLSVALALFLFASLRSVNTTLDKALEAGSETRMIVRNATGIVFPLPMSYAQRLAAVPGVGDVSWANWFGGSYQSDRHMEFASFSVDAPSFLRIYPEIVVTPEHYEAFMADRTGAVVGVDLLQKYGWRVGQAVTLRGSIYPGDWQFTIRGTYTVTNESFDEMSFIFHYRYLEERTERRAMPGWYYLKLNDPSAAATVASTIDEMFRNSSHPTRTETERAFNAGFITMWGNVRFLMNTIGMAVVFAILLVTGNAMMMSARERTGEIAVLKTLGYGDGLLFAIEMGEAGTVALAGAVLGLGGARLFWDSTEILSRF